MVVGRGGARLGWGLAAGRRKRLVPVLRGAVRGRGLVARGHMLAALHALVLGRARQVSPAAAATAPVPARRVPYSRWTLLHMAILGVAELVVAKRDEAWFITCLYRSL